MTLVELLAALPPTGIDGLAFPRHLLGAFRRKSITFCTGVTDETTIVYWFQSRSFTIDLRLPDGPATPLLDRQGWVGDTLWDGERQEMSWSIARSYQLRDQWPEPARLHLIGNAVLEFAPSGAYAEDWRQQALRGPLLGLRLVGLIDSEGREAAMDGGLIVAGEHIAYAQSRLPDVDERLLGTASLGDALAGGSITENDIESYEVSVALDGDRITHTTRPALTGEAITAGEFAIQPDGSILLSRTASGQTTRLRLVLDLFVPDFLFDRQTACTPDAQQWLEAGKSHLARHAAIRA